MLKIALESNLFDRVIVSTDSREIADIAESAGAEIPFIRPASLANDYSYDTVFSRQCESLVLPGDVVIGISTSGNSKNVKEGVGTAKKKGAITIGLLGNNGGILKNSVDFSLIVGSNITSEIQEAHRVIYHIICKIVEKELAKK